MKKLMTAVLAGAAFAALLGMAAADDDGDWIATWTASAQPAWEADFAVPLGMPANLWNHTIRQVARTSIGGGKVRVVVSNEYGKLPLKIGAAHIGVTKDGAAIQPGSGKALTFSGSPSITIPPGAPVISDPVDLKVAPLSELSVSLFFPESAPATTIHWDGHQTAYVAAGNKVADEELKADSTQTQRAFLTGIMVDAPDDARAIVLFGDSITDGDGSTIDGNDRWPDTLAERLAQAGGDPVAVLNQGISGAKVLSDRMGVNALARFDRDVLNQPRADTVVLMMGINDIGWPGTGLAPHDPEPTAEDIIAGYRQLIARAHADDMRIIGATLTPFGDSFAGSPFEGYYTPDKEKVRLAVNDFIRNSKEFDGVIDFDKVVVDPARPGYIKAEFDKGDHLHPNAAGYDAMASSIDLELLADD
ncbi:SGNH/GDSL hydrolase family protein [Mesorhizobium sp. LHD-90]|uniref:SGNH/GDSL hydrolase family protein n=1 Tax=Mesorhizobium sp. LHD-90 TaxID=3071414 RepID=UPI0027E1CEA8|nr:SGNH/GDSL hydrolase family protein [Mesorhizobium sp. LHD-90]MDQ6434219.1 SGNH/GDSL hydrolase family protein [Mesorhizobium sp. LHD-90]